MKKHIISVCLGSSCYPRGNRDILCYIKDYIRNRHCEERVELKGELCSGLCSQGPVISINGKVYTRLTIDAVQEILDELLSTGGKK